VVVSGSVLLEFGGGGDELHRGNRLTGMGHCGAVWWLACRRALL
jgi:hypothetical protein